MNRKFITKIIQLMKKDAPMLHQDYKQSMEMVGPFGERYKRKEAVYSALHNIILRIEYQEEPAPKEKIFIDKFIALFEELFDLQKFTYDGETYSLSDFNSDFIFLLITKIYVQEMSEEEFNTYLNEYFKFMDAFDYEYDFRKKKLYHE